MAVFSKKKFEYVWTFEGSFLNNMLRKLLYICIWEYWFSVLTTY